MHRYRHMHHMHRHRQMHMHMHMHNVGRFYPAEEAHAERFVSNLAASELSMALLQSYFMLYRDSAEQVGC